MMRRGVGHPCLPGLALVFGVLLLGGGAVPAAAQSTCSLRLAEAAASSRAGRFPEALEAIAACLAAQPSREERSHALELRAEIEIASDDLDHARKTVEELLRGQPEFVPNPYVESPRFVRLVEQARAGGAQVISVSKTRESLREAPATVAVVTAAEIARRGYKDVEELLHDLPGFDIARDNGVAYANVYQRGYRSNTTDRTLFLVDGVEQNDLTANTAYLTRQYPLTDVARVEVIYGPASTLYGANAFLGVINIITKDPAEVLREGRQAGGEAVVGGGSFATYYGDAVVAARTADGAVSGALSARLYRSDEYDLSRFPDWQYSPSFYDRIDYASVLAVTGVDAKGKYRAQRVVDERGVGPSDLYTIVRNAQGVATAILPTARGVERARALDKAALSQIVGGKPVGFSDLTDDRWLSGRLKLGSFDLGVQTWTQREGETSWYTDRQAPGADNGAIWAPRQLAVTARYSRPFPGGFSLRFQSSYKLHDLGPETTSFTLNNYAGGRLHVDDLAQGRAAQWQETFLFRSSSQLHGELSGVYAPVERFSLVAGLEFRSGSIQGDYIKSKLPNASETGTAPPLPGGNQFAVRDLGVYGQLSYRLRRDLKAVAGGRVDNNQVRQRGGYGTVFNPRLALLYLPGRWVFKGIYSEAFTDASNFDRYSTLPGQRDLSNPNLRPEKVKNFEVSAGWQGEGVSASVAAYEAHFSDVVALQRVPFDDGTPFGNGTTTQFQNLGRRRVRGVQGEAAYDLGRLELYGNVTFTNPVDLDPKDASGQPLVDGGGRRITELRVGDIAGHQANLGGNLRWGEKLNVNLRLNYVGPRPTGQGTTVPTNPYTSIASYVTGHLTLTWNEVVRGASLRLLINNLANRQYYDPGVREAGQQYAARVPQPGRAFFLSVLARL
jgi:outer membrane receptor for ferrienterochelin and colicins